MSGNEEHVARQKMAHTLRLAGLTWAEVAATDYAGGRLYSDGTAACRAAHAYRATFNVDDDQLSHRAMDMARFDALQRAMWRKALSGDLAAAKFVLQIMKARQDLLGIKGVQPPQKRDDPLDELAARRSAS